jgi:hypothetical protein
MTAIVVGSGNIFFVSFYYYSRRMTSKPSVNDLVSSKKKNKTTGA